MPLDAVVIHAIKEELEKELIGARIDKVQMPERDVLLLSVRGNMGTDKPGFFSVFHLDICLTKAHLPGTDRFDLTALQGNACFICFQDKILKPRFAVGCYDFLTHMYYFSTNDGFSANT